jgi:hypothetical protein
VDPSSHKEVTIPRSDPFTKCAFPRSDATSATTKLVPAGRVRAAAVRPAPGISSAGIPAQSSAANHLCVGSPLDYLCIIQIQLFCFRQQPAQQSSSSAGCTACLAGMCLCCCAEGALLLLLLLHRTTLMKNYRDMRVPLLSLDWRIVLFLNSTFCTGPPWTIHDFI